MSCPSLSLLPTVHHRWASITYQHTTVCSEQKMPYAQRMPYAPECTGPESQCGRAPWWPWRAWWGRAPFCLQRERGDEPRVRRLNEDFRNIKENRDYFETRASISVLCAFCTVSLSSLSWIHRHMCSWGAQRWTEHDLILPLREAFAISGFLHSSNHDQFFFVPKRCKVPGLSLLELYPQSSPILDKPLDQFHLPRADAELLTRDDLRLFRLTIAEILRAVFHQQWTEIPKKTKEISRLK